MLFSNRGPDWRSEILDRLSPYGDVTAAFAGAQPGPPQTASAFQRIDAVILDRVRAAVALAVFLGKDEFQLRRIIVGIDETRRFGASLRSIFNTLYLQGPT